MMNSAVQSMAQIINQNTSLLTNFEFQIHETDCGSILFDYDYVSNCMERHYDYLGVAHLAANKETTILSYLDLFKEKGITIPQ